MHTNCPTKHLAHRKEMKREIGNLLHIHLTPHQKSKTNRNFNSQKENQRSKHRIHLRPLPQGRGKTKQKVTGYLGS